MLAKNLIELLLEEALATGSDFAEIFCEESRRNQLSMANGDLEKAISGIDAGIGLRLLHGDQCLYTFSNDLDEQSLVDLVRKTAAALRGKREYSAAALEQWEHAMSHPWQVSAGSVEKTQKTSRLLQATRAASGYDTLISQTRCNFIELERKIRIANSEGLLTDDERVYNRFSIEAVASSESEKQTGFIAPGVRRGYEWFAGLDVEELAREAARMAVTMLKAQPAPSGKMPVVIDNAFGGVIFHEACGHSLEATALARKASVFQDMLGQKIASPLVTAVDDATLPHEWGSIDIDDEGIAGRKNVLIEKGILKSYLVDRHNGRKLGMKSTGSGRRESYRFAPTSRMSNTFIAAGDTSPESIIRDTPYGLYAKSMGGGSVDPASGEFNFAVQEAYMIRDGQVAEPVRGATLIGKGADVLLLIDKVGNNLAMAQGMCGSMSGMVPTNVGQPMIRVSQMTVGGRGKA